MGCKPSRTRLEARKAKQVLQHNHHGMCTPHHPNRKSGGHQRRNIARPRASYSFSLNFLNNPDVAHYLAVFDEYCVTKIEIHQTPRSNQAAIINATEPVGGTNPVYWNAVTHVATECEPQVSSPTSAIQVMQQDSYFNIEQTKSYRFSFKPRAVIVAQGQNGRIQTSAKPNTWISCQDGTALHSGIQWYADPCMSATTQPGAQPNAVSWWVRFFVSFRNT